MNHKLPLVVLAAAWFGLKLAANCPAAEQVLALIPSDEYTALISSVQQWRTDVQSEGQYAVVPVPVPSDWTAAQIRSFLASLYAAQKNGSSPLAGVLMVGNLPWAMAVDTTGGKGGPYPTDQYFMDLTSTWTPVGTNYLVPANLSCNIWVGRLMPNMPGLSTNSEIQLIKDYFVKNHKVRTGALSLPSAGLAYCLLDWAGRPETQGLGLLYPALTIVNEPQETQGDDYLDRLAHSDGFEFVYLDCHSFTTYHEIPDSNPWLYPNYVESAEIHAADPKGFFFWLDTCYAGRFIDCNYLAGAYIFDSTYGLTAVARTALTGSPLTLFRSLHDADGKNWGEIVLAYFADNSLSDFVILGDPTLSPVFESPKCRFSIPGSYAKPILVPRSSTSDACWYIPVSGAITSGTTHSILRPELTGWPSSASTEIFLAWAAATTRLVVAMFSS